MKELILYVLAAIPTQKCLDDAKPKPFVYFLNGSTVAVQGMTPAKSIPPLFATGFNDQALQIPDIDPACYDIFKGHLSVPFAKVQAPKK